MAWKRPAIYSRTLNYGLTGFGGAKGCARLSTTWMDSGVASHYLSNHGISMAFELPKLFFCYLAKALGWVGNRFGWIVGVFRLLYYSYSRLLLLESVR